MRLLISRWRVVIRGRNISTGNCRYHKSTVLLKTFAMKKKLLLIAGCAAWLLSLLPADARAQLNPLDSINLQLRNIFTPLFRPAPQKEFLYDMAAHVTSHPFNRHNSLDTITSDEWYRIYEECYYMAYDTTWLQKSDAIYDNVVNIPGDTIPIGILDFDYYRLKPNALTTPQYFIFDTVNNLLYDIPGRPDEPYTTDNVFAAAPLFHMAQTSTVTFKVDASFIFKDAANAIYYSGTPYDLYVDFGDGTGKHLFNSMTPPYYTAYYQPGVPYANIRTTIENDGLEIKLSISELILGPSAAFTLPDFSYLLGQHDEEIEVSVFGATGSCTNPGDRKVVIYLAGFQMLDFIPKFRRSAGEVYDHMISDPQIANLKNFGYEFHIVTWGNSRQDIRSNAMTVVALIDNLKQAYGTDHQFIIIGESMGGLVARYAMCYMESAAYQDPLAWPTGVARGFMHNTRELITFDVPHQGANVPLSIQTFYDDALEFFGFMSPMSARFVMRVFNLFLDGDAAKQMLIYHIDTKSGWGLYKNYTSHPKKTQFFNDLANLSLSGNGYPSHCKLVALSNGSLSGTAQRRFYNTTMRVPNDRLMDTGFELYARVLWFHVPIYGGNLRILTNPNGQGQIYQQNLGRWGIRLKFYWFGVKLITGYNSVTNRSEFADVLPICTSAGGYFDRGLETVIGNSTFNNSWALSKYTLFNLFAYSTGSDGNGCWNFSAHVGINGFASVNTNIWACSDGFHFCFVPVQSALDYGVLGVSPPLLHDIENDPLATKLASSPFDVMSGIASTEPFPIMPNMSHLYIKYEDNEGFLMSSNFGYAACGGSIYGHWLNREIGDEVLYLDNFEAAWNSTYESYDWLIVNGANPAYNGGTLDGIYSRSDPFTHAAAIPPLHSTFSCDATIHFPPPTYHYSVSGLPPSEYTIIQTNGFNCCNQYRFAASELPGEESMTIYPNPVDGTHVLAIDLVATSEAPVELSVIDFTGRVMKQSTLTDNAVPGKQTFTVPLGELQLAPGVYMVRVKTGNSEFQRKLIVQ